MAQKVRGLDSDGDMAFGYGEANFLTGDAAIRQKVKTRLELYQGEWFLDVEDGTPWFQQVLGKPRSLPLIEAVVKQRILETDGVTDLIEFQMTLDRDTRLLDMAGNVVTENGSLLDIGV